MTKHLLALLSLFIILPFVSGTSLAASPSPSTGKEQPKESTSASQPTSSFELFWPIVAGRVPGDPLYTLKRLRETISEKLKFSEIRKADYRLTLSKKRLVETEKLLEQKAYANAEKSIKDSVAELKNAIDLAKTAEQKGKATQGLFNALSDNGQRELIFLSSLIDRIPTENQGAFKEALAQIDEMVKNLGQR
ncbi:MAG: DUF5667 domain-containing protein [bacterium]|nr:DUF5667 domain-containing protein [bacterium]